MNNKDILNKIKILRPVRITSLISAQVFENHFTKHLGDVFDISSVPLIDFCSKILGTWEEPVNFSESVDNFQQSAKGYDFICPSYECILITPFLMVLRNSCKSSLRLLFVAHSAGAYAMEWTLLRPLLVPGDIIVAPSLSAKKAIQLLCPELTPFIRNIPHPINILPGPQSNFGKDKRDINIVTLGRIIPTKLIHRQIEAVNILIKRGMRNIRMHIAGSLKDPATGEISIYARSLKSKIERLKLTNHVFLYGEISGEQNKSNFISGASLSINLSSSIEESFPKAAVEPLGLGIPVIACYWNGFVEIVDNCGKLIQLTEFKNGFLDIEPEHIADAIEDLLKHPVPPEQCISRAKKYIPFVIKRKYLKVLLEAKKTALGISFPCMKIFTGKGVIPETKGLVGKIACLSPFPWKKLMTFHIAYSKKIRALWENSYIEKIYEEEILRDLVLLSISTPISYFYAGKNYKKWTAAAGAVNVDYSNESDFMTILAKAVEGFSIITSKIANLYVLSKNNEVDLLNKSLHLIENFHNLQMIKDYYKMEVDYKKCNYSIAYERFLNQIKKEDISSRDSQMYRQIAGICREWGKPEISLPWLQAWLEKFPDEPDSGSVWLDYTYNQFLSGATDREVMSALFNTLKQLLGIPPYIKRLEQAYHISLWCKDNDGGSIALDCQRKTDTR